MKNNGKEENIGWKDEPANNEGGVLARLFRDIIYTRKYTTQMLNVLVSRYIDRYQTSDTKADAKKTKTQMNKNLFSSEMTIKVFLDLVIRLLNAKKLIISIKVTTYDGVETVHSCTLQGEKEYGKQPNSTTDDGVNRENNNRVD